MNAPLESRKAVGGYQPIPMPTMDFKEAPSSPHACEVDRQHYPSRRCEYKTRNVGQEEVLEPEYNTYHRRCLRCAAHFSFASVLMLALVLFVTFKCRLDQLLFESYAVNGGSSLEKRQSTGSTGSSNDGSQDSFVNKKC